MSQRAPLTTKETLLSNADAAAIVAAIRGKNDKIEFAEDARWKWVQKLAGSPFNLLSLAAGQTVTLYHDKGISGYLYNIFLQLNDQNTEYINTLYGRGGQPSTTDFTMALLQSQGYTNGTSVRVLRYDEVNTVFCVEFVPGPFSGFGTPFRDEFKAQLVNPNPFAISYFWELEYLQMEKVPK